MEMIEFWRNTFRVEAVRITEGNIKEIAEKVGAEYWEFPKHIVKDRRRAFVGDWYVYVTGIHQFFSHDNFTRKFQTHEEILSSDEKYAKVYQLVKSAMSKQDAATYHGDTAAMDLEAIETTRKILGQL